MFSTTLTTCSLTLGAHWGFVYYATRIQLVYDEHAISMGCGDGSDIYNRLSLNCCDFTLISMGSYRWCGAQWGVDRTVGSCRECARRRVGFSLNMLRGPSGPRFF